MISKNVEKGWKTLLALVLFGAIGTLQAETYYPTAGGDISTAAGWGGTLPASDDAVVFSNGTYTAANDVGFGAVTVYGGGTFDFTDDPTRTITLTVERDTKDAAFIGTGANGSTLAFKGGTWYFANGGVLNFAYSDSRNSSARRTVLLSDGVCFTNAYLVRASTSEYYDTFRMTGRSSIYCTGRFILANSSAKDMVSEILDGSTICAYSFATDAQPSNGGPSFTVIAGEGTCVTTTATSVKVLSVTGTYLDGHTLYVTNGAQFTLAGAFDLGASWQHSTAGDRAANRNVLRIAHGATMEAAVLNVGVHHENNSTPVYLARESGVASCSNDVQVLSGGKLVCRNLFLGANQCSYGNRLTVADDALLVMKGGVGSNEGLHIGYYGSGNEMVLSNVTGYTESNLLPECRIGGSAGSSNNVFRITGAASHVRFSGLGGDRFGFGSYNEFIVENGAFLDTVDTRWNSMTSSTGCTLRVRGNARLKVDRTLYVGNVGSGVGCGNRVVIEDGGAYTNSSGGILLALSAGIAADCPYPNGFELKNGRADMQALTVSTNCYAEFSGTNPVLKATAGCSVAWLGKLRFVVPRTGYVGVPYSSKSLTMQEGSTLEIDLSSKPYLDEPLTLVSCTTAVTIPASVLTAANEALGKKGQVYLDSTGKKLMLRVWRKGTSVTLR